MQYKPSIVQQSTLYLSHFTLLGMVEASNSSGGIDQRLGPALYKAKQKQSIC
jgi:hypothetical protein